MEQELKIAQQEVKTRDRLKTFMNTKAYKEFIVDGFQNDEVVRISQALIEDAMQDEIDQRLLKQKVTAGAHLGQYFLTVIQAGNRAQMQIEDAKEEEIKTTIQENQELVEYDNITGDEIVKSKEA